MNSDKIAKLVLLSGALLILLVAGGMVFSLVEDLNDKKELSDLIARHYELTGSKIAEKILTSMDDYMDRFIRIIPYEYKKVLQELQLEEIRKKLASVEKDVEMMGDV